MAGHPPVPKLCATIALAALLVPLSGALPTLPDTLDGVRTELARAGIPPSVLPLVGLPPTAVPLPADPEGALAGEIARFLGDFGLPNDPKAQVAAAQLDPALAGRAAQALAALHACLDATRSAGATLPPAALEQAMQGRLVPEGGAAVAAIHACALPAAQALVNLEAAAGAAPVPKAAAPSLLDIWPVIAIDQAGDDAYENDYILIVDTAGDDLYDNNAGSNLIDLRFAPASSPFPGIDPIPHVAGVNDGDDDRSGYGPSEGCSIAVNSLQAGNCTPAVAAVVDTAGSDQYGLFETPVPGVDARCTADLVIRRMVTNGAGLLGFGMILDSIGNDRYNGRTGSGGVAHVFGVGILQDRQGDDDYLDIRNAQGFALLGGLGLLLDEAGDDEYRRYMPSALVPGTPDEQDGAGGVIDDTNFCDNQPRLMQGAAFLPGSVGILADLGGQDFYEGACTIDFGATLLGNGDIGAPVCSQGFGASGGVGVLADRGGRADTYLGVLDRGDGVTLLRAAAVADTDLSDPADPRADGILSIEAFRDS